MSIKKNIGAQQIVISQSVDAIYIVGIVLEQLVSDADLFAIVVGGLLSKGEQRLIKQIIRASQMVLSQSLDVIYIGGILFEELISDTDLFGTVVGVSWARDQG